MSKFQLKRGPLSELPSTLDEGDHYLAIDQTPPQLYVGPQGGGTPKSIERERPKTYIAEVGTTVTTSVDDFGDISVSTVNASTIGLTSSSTSFDGKTLINLTGTTTTPNPTFVIQGDGSIHINVDNSSLGQYLIFIKIQSFE